MQQKKAIWIDLDNSPHVPLFVPLIKDYRENGVEVILTARNHSQTVELLQKAGFDKTFEIIGKHYGKSKIKKIYGLIIRAKQLSSFIKKFQKNKVNVMVAVSHGSRAMVLAAKWLKIPIISLYDYEFTETAIFNYLSDQVLIPDKIPDNTLDKINLSKSKRIKYQGYKEELYLKNYQPDKNFWQNFTAENNLNLTEDIILTALRPPATTANYHNNFSENLFSELLKYVLNHVQTFTVILPRTNEQRGEIKQLIDSLNINKNRYFLLDKTINGLDLACCVDLLISGGGTMNREAALLGIPVYSIFAGKQGSLDLHMEQNRLITFIRQPQDLKKIKLEKRISKPTNINRIDLPNDIENVLKEKINYWFEKT